MDGKPSEITPEHIYMNRRSFMKSAGLFASGALLAACAPPGVDGSTTVPTASSGDMQDAPALTPEYLTDDLGDPATSYDGITTYNNFYEFSVHKEEVVNKIDDFEIDPWLIRVTGLVNKPGFYSPSDLIEKFGEEERIYRLRCVEGWSMVIPWLGFPLHKLLEFSEPLPEAKYVRFESDYQPKTMPGVNIYNFDWPYQEGLRLDEAMHDLTFIATGLYGKPMPKQNGAPIRLVVPWKYGFKSIKSIIEIELTDTQPFTFWNTANASEYGFYSNVNPNVDHPRWSQATERRIGETGRRPTLMFNGYDEVASLYEGMDLEKNY